METQRESLDTIIERKFKSFTNARLIARANRLPDFKWDDEEFEVHRRIKASNGAFVVEMQGDRLIILKDE